MTVPLASVADRLGATVTPPSGSSGASASPGIDDVVIDSRSVVAGSLFCCVVGRVHDGHDHAAEAVEAGAVALLCERRLPLDVAQIVVDDVRASMPAAAAVVHGDPSRRLEVVGVTGTNGKTTVVTMIAAIMAAADRPAVSIGTLTGERTTPEAPDLQRRLARLADDGVEVVAMEVSSHALAQHRVDSIGFSVGVFTNLGSDHLDYHETREAYFAAKARLFEPGRCRVAVLNIDDTHGRLLRDAGEGPVVEVTAADAADLVVDRSGSRFDWRGAAVQLRLQGRHNVVNALLAAAACAELGVSPDRVARGLSTLEVVPGRAETFPLPGGAVAVVDFAHTPDALEAVLDAARDMTGGRGRVTVVFGCGGDRDRQKRPEMGRVACASADRVLLTSDNPRSEDPAAIIAEILAGCGGGRTVAEVEPDRATAIRAALGAAGADDVVVVAGKGHEQGQQFRDGTLPFDDREQVREAIAGMGGPVA